MKKMTKKHKLRILLVFLLLEVIVLSGSVIIVSAIENGANETSFQDYKFSASYSSHDWVADCAIRLIAGSPAYSEQINWLYNTLDNIKYSALDLVARSFDSSISTPVFDSHNERINARRYVTFLHGTFAPDKGLSYENVELPPAGVLQKEILRKYHPIWSRPSTYINYHCHYFIRNEELISFPWTSSKYVTDIDIWRYWSFAKYAVNGWAPEAALVAALDALRWLNKKDSNGVVGGDAKYEAASFCLGGMTHFIADVSTPMHTIRWPEFNEEGLIHKAFEFFVAKYTLWDEATSGPSKVSWNPWEWMNENGLELKPMIPFEACLRQAEYTQLGTDYQDECKSLRNVQTGDFIPVDPMGIGGDDYYEYHPYCAWGMANNVDVLEGTAYGERQKELVYWAVYHSACAILWVCELANMNGRNTYYDRNKPSSGVTIREIPDHKQVTEWINGNKISDAEKWADLLGVSVSTLTNLTGLSILLAPALAALLVSMTYPIITKKGST